MLAQGCKHSDLTCVKPVHTVTLEQGTCAYMQAVQGYLYRYNMLTHVGVCIRTHADLRTYIGMRLFISNYRARKRKTFQQHNPLHILECLSKSLKRILQVVACSLQESTRSVNEQVVTYLLVSYLPAYFKLISISIER